MKNNEYIKDLDELQMFEFWDRIKIYDSYKVRKRDFERVFELIKYRFPNTKLFENRTYFDLKMEWAVHNFLYKLNMYEDRVKDVDLDYVLSKKDLRRYKILGILSWIFIK